MKAMDWTKSIGRGFEDKLDEINISNNWNTRKWNLKRLSQDIQG